MIINNINLNLLRVFLGVYRLQSMTKAASELFMTQSGVSQNIKNLEDILGFKLFDRVKQKPLPTSNAKLLYECCEKNLGEIEDLLLKLTGKEETLAGEVHIGLPLEFGNNKILPILAKFGRKHKEVDFSIKYGHAVEMNQLLVKGELDFAFIDQFNVDRQVHIEKVIDEQLVLCCTKDYFNQLKLKESNKVDFYKKLDYVDYIEGAPVLKMWFKHHLKTELDVRIRANLMDVQGMGRIICEGLGAGVLPLHVVERLQKEGHKFHSFNGSGKAFVNEISIATLEGRTFSPVVTEARDFILKTLRSS